MQGSPLSFDTPLPHFQNLTLNTGRFTGQELAVEDFVKLFKALQEKWRTLETAEPLKPPVLFSSQSNTPLKSPILFLDFDGVCWVDHDDVPNEKYLALLKNEELIALINHHFPMLKKHYDFETVKEFLRFSCFQLENMQRIASLCKEFNTRIVVTSNWRKGRTIEHLVNMLDMWGIGQYVIDKTVDGGFSICRSKQIEAWLKANEQRVSSFVILDDQYILNLTKMFLEKFIHCDCKIAFDEETYQKAKSCLQDQCIPANDQNHCLDKPNKERKLSS
jgi:hypothetical protein